MVKQATKTEQPVEGAEQGTPQQTPEVPEQGARAEESPKATDTKGEVNWEHRAKSAEGLVKSLQGKVTELESTHGFQDEVKTTLTRLNEAITEMASWQLDMMASTDSEKAESISAGQLKREIASLGLSEDDPRLYSLKQIGTAKEALGAWNKYVKPAMKTAMAFTQPRQVPPEMNQQAATNKPPTRDELLRMVKEDKTLKEELKKALLSEDGAYDVLTASPTGGAAPTDVMGVMRMNLARAQRVTKK